MDGCEMPQELTKKGAMKEVLAALTRQMWDRMKAGKSEAAMSGKDVAEALEEAGEGETMDPAMAAMHEGTESGGEMEMEGESKPKPKDKVLELSTVKLGLLAPNRKGGMRSPPPMPEAKRKGRK